METVKCTPRPWRAELGEVHEVRDSEGGRICLLTQLRGKHGLGGRRADHESPANAYLIAAAPDLYEALTRSIVALEALYPSGERIELEHEDEQRAVAALLDYSRAAIAKTEGKAGA